VPDFVSLDGIRWCQRNNVAYMGTWHSNYIEYLKFYYIEWVLGPGMSRYLRGFFEQLPTVYVPTTYVRFSQLSVASNHFDPLSDSFHLQNYRCSAKCARNGATARLPS